MVEETVEIIIEKTQTLDAMLHQVLNQALVIIGAEAGSLMLVDNKQGILQIKARLGKPQPGRKTERVLKTDDKNIAGWVVQNKQSYLCSDVENDPFFAPHVLVRISCHCCQFPLYMGIKLLQSSMLMRLRKITSLKWTEKDWSL